MCQALRIALGIQLILPTMQGLVMPTLHAVENPGVTLQSVFCFVVPLYVWFCICWIQPAVNHVAL